jgi:metal-responsive CopG/Arc/MetJ family transcriptional regulator
MKERPQTYDTRISLVLPQSRVDAIDAYGRENGGSSRSSYCRRAIEAALREDGLLKANAAA